MRVAVAIIFLIVFLMPQIVSAGTIEDKQRELNQINQKIAEQQRILNQKTKERRTLANQVASMDAQIGQTEYSIQKTQTEIDLTQAEIESLINQIREKQKELAYQQSVLNETIRVVYEETSTSFLEMLFSSDDFSQVLDNTEYLGAIEGKISSTMDEINKIKAGLAKDKKDQENKKTELANFKNQYSATLVSLSDQQSTKNQLLVKTKGQESAYQSLLAQTKQDYSEARTELAQMERAASGGGVGAPSAFGFYWPTDSHVTCGSGCEFCGYRTPSGGCHSGIDIVIPEGTPIRASKDGTVDLVVTGKGNTYPWDYIYGNYVVIRHDGGFFTIYGHMSFPIVGIRQGVSAGQIIGYSGNSGYSRGAHLHFEIQNPRYHPWNPRLYLP